MIGKTVLVTGGAGFIGTNLTARLLDEGASVIIVDNLQTGQMANLARFDKKLPLKFLRADISDPLPALGHVDEIYNLACAASPPHYQADPVHTMMTSVTGTLQLLRLAEATGARLVMASTSEVYGDPKEHPQRESYLGNVSTTGPRACYDEGKRAAETLCSDFQRRGVDVRIARIFNTYGPFMRSDDGRVVSNVICQALTDQDITIYGEGHQTRSFCFVDDLVDGLMRLMRVETAPDGPVNLGDPAAQISGVRANCWAGSPAFPSGAAFCKQSIGFPQRSKPARKRRLTARPSPERSGSQEIRRLRGEGP
jgi:UDP-glucuronate decarboxylase